MNEIERYQFDVQGYLILDDVLSQEEVAEHNRLVDAQQLTEPGLETSGARFSNYLSWGQPPTNAARCSTSTAQHSNPGQRRIFSRPMVSR